ncbi:uncharacterized protein LOC119649365 isoform X2 [Hermetia illucens]|uniref:uncharacterized protein LOC119649365 isoform X2 n=1 Tax=Hermetia illucens TaxID=343691 RepID=UPI0018CC024F|nr:uncharacterized protein LOC119649365 isoform X2 [Hermetia illucens]
MLKSTIILAVAISQLLELATSENGYSRDVPSNQLQYPGTQFSGYQYGNEEDLMVGSVPGIPGRDYPTYAFPPDTSFRCQDQRFPGYYADPEARCQVFHICQTVCDWWNHVDCARAREFYSINEVIQRAMEEATQRLLYEAAQRAREQYESGYNYRNPLLNGANGYYADRDQGTGSNQIAPNRQYLPSN